jgi:glycosyltransferase involved in cell wall biosynthesis
MMMNTEEIPLVSVCIPCYNAEKHIAETIASVINQTYQNWEIIVCDNCSTDGTFKILQSYKDPRITILQNESNIGFLANSQKVMSLAKGKYIKWLCADDLITADCIEKQVNIFVEAMRATPVQNIALVSATKQVIKEDGKKLFTKGFPQKGLINGRKAIVKSVLCGGNAIGEPGLVLMDAERLKKTKGAVLDEKCSYIADIDLWNKMLKYGDLYVLPDILFSFRVTKTSISASKGQEQAKTVKRFFKKLQQENSISKIEQLLGCIMATLTSTARILTYRFS